ncbi:unnamed protein product [Orchesella dallaii]|uniref:Thromboxane-A synthase n=1 Tax=Orchesella dallaii TaxID=48710 RepID=A0ABP1R835_9HEXA
MVELFTKLGIPGPCPNFFVGNMMELMGKGKLVTEVMAEWENQFGLVYGYFRGTRATLVVRDAELIKDILVRNSSEFINRPHMIMNVPPLPYTLVGLRSQRWKEVRNTLSPTFSSAKIKQMLPIMSNCVQTTLEILKEKSKSEVRSGEQAVDAHKLFQGLACDVISACALAMKVNAQRDENDRFFRAVRGFLENAMGPFVKIALCFPLLATVMEWALKTFGYSHEMTKMIMENVQTAMKIRRDNHSTSGSVPVDALQLMMDATVQEHSTSPPSESTTGSARSLALSDDEIVANAWVFILGGFETTSASLSFTCYLLSIHQDIQERLFTELKASFAADESPSYDQISELAFLDQVVCESLRLYPPVVSFVVRGMDKDCQIGPYHVPKNVGIQIPIWQVHHDPEIWSEPYRFDPDRFEDNAKKSYGNNMQWIPFGTGPRNCIGARFALLNLKFTLCSVLRKFKVVPASNHHSFKLKLKVPSVTIVPEEGIPLRFLPRIE